MKILIVDDETISRKILLKKMESIGECTSVDDSTKAIQLFDKAVKAKTPYDLITLDVSMPKMDGSQLLRMIRKKEDILKTPKENRVKIIMVTARMNTSTIKSCIKFGCDGYISKPVTTYQLLENLSRMGFDLPSDTQKPDTQKETENFHDKIVANIIKRFYKGKIKLPVLPRIVKDVRELKENPDASIEDLNGILENDIAISARLISIANSALYKGVDHADTLNAALVRLGMKASCDLVTTIVARDLFQSENKKIHILLERLWMHSFACGALGKQLAQDMEMENSDTVFLMGIVHDIGKMLLIKAILDIHPEELFENIEIQLAIHEIHTTFGAALLKKMKFSIEFIHIAEFHHWNDFSIDDDKALLIIHLSDYLATEIGFGFFQDESEKKDQFEDLANIESFKKLNLDLEKTMEMAQKVKALISSSSNAF